VEYRFSADYHDLCSGLNGGVRGNTHAQFRANSCWIAHCKGKARFPVFHLDNTTIASEFARK
jgi:hypothetical protein